MKIGYGLVAALAAACGVVAIAPMQAQGVKPAKTVKPSPAPKAAGGLMSEVVGSIGETKITYGEVVARVQKENPSGFNQTVAQLIGLDAAKSMFGPAPKSSYAVTKPEVMALLRKTNPPLLGDTLKTMLEFDAVDREVKKKGIAVTTSQVDTRIDQFLKLLRTQGRIPQGVTDAQFLAQNHVDRDTLRKNFLVQAKLFTLIQQDFVEKRLGHKLTPDDFFKARHILIKVPMAPPGQTPADAKKADDAALAKIKLIAADIDAKKVTFEDAAKKSSEDDGSKEMGGELGIQMRTVFVPEFEAAAYKLKPMEVSQPIKSQFGYHLIQLEQRGAEIPEADRQAYLDNFESGQMQIFLRDLLTTKYHAVNKLARETPAMMMPGQ
ncbi:MAG: Parvulin-like peptidyl-prolyl isomerase [Chthonomonadaceae bacterium]|nr:Parvulin-like peptidyl-prolyl isomerase [Chthonomonadaceae bacterium]